ncbi:hypothetical protein [Streptomyces longispororuber]|uniref:hypothetical protein n=1 Tax=Streptomyces longispororuber TaxID=68230 RepID=UPI00167E0734|nr:hypothetical protein [Streptomyces longispororuber]
MHDHRPGATPGGARLEPMALEVRHPTAGGPEGCGGGRHERVLRIERNACVAAVSDDDSADRFLARLLGDDARLLGDDARLLGDGDRLSEHGTPDCCCGTSGTPGMSKASGPPGASGAVSVAVYGVDPRTDPEAVRRLVGVVPEGMPLPEAPVHDALVAAARQRGLPADTAAERATDLTDALDLRAVERTPVAELTPGQRSRAALGCALLHVPRLLLLSRPLDDVDSVSEKILCRVLGRYTASTGTVVFSTRSRDVARRVTDRLVTVRGGEVRCDCLPTAR